MLMEASTWYVAPGRRTYIIKQASMDSFEGVCPYHRNCFEGLASGPSIEKRWNKKPYELKERPGLGIRGVLYRTRAG